MGAEKFDTLKSRIPEIGLRRRQRSGLFLHSSRLYSTHLLQRSPDSGRWRRFWSPLRLQFRRRPRATARLSAKTLKI